MKHKPLIVAIAVLITLSVGRLGVSASYAAMSVQDKYCDNVLLYNESSGRFGWPDYKGNAKTNCPTKLSDF